MMNHLDKKIQSQLKTGPQPFTGSGLSIPIDANCLKGRGLCCIVFSPDSTPEKYTVSGFYFVHPETLKKSKGAIPFSTSPFLGWTIKVDSRGFHVLGVVNNGVVNLF